MAAQKPSIKVSDAAVKALQQVLSALTLLSDEKKVKQLVTVQHKPIRTMKENLDACATKMKGIFTKCLFLKDKKKRYFLCTVIHDRKVNFKVLAQHLVRV